MEGEEAAPEIDSELQDFASALKQKKKKKSKETKETGGNAEDNAPASSSNLESNLASSNEGGATNSEAPPKSAVSPAPTSEAAKVNQKAMYQQLLTRVYDELRSNNPDLVNKKKSVLRPPQVMRVGTSRILWVNFAEICKMMKRDPEHVFRFFLAELGTTGSIDGSQRFLLKGKFVPKYIESLLKKYISEYVTCNGCRGVDTRLARDPMNRMYVMHCETCGAGRAVTAIQKGYHATAKGERKALRNVGT